jgi:hypothetical protein
LSQRLHADRRQPKRETVRKLVATEILAGGGSPNPFLIVAAVRLHKLMISHTAGCKSG